MAMEACCDLEVDVNGEESFMVDKNKVASYSGKFRKLFGKSIAAITTKTRLKVVFHDFPGGAESFELVLRHCYGSGRTQISPSNISRLYLAAKFMEMNHLLEQTEKSFEEMRYWSWSELLTAVKQSHNLPPVERCLDCLAERLATSPASPCPSNSSPESSALRLSFDTKSSESSKTNALFSSRTNWWFEDLVFLSPEAVKILANSMIARRFDHAVLSKFLFHYHRSKLGLAAAGPAEKRKVNEAVVDSLGCLDLATVQCKSLFELGRAVGPGSRTGKGIREKVEGMIGSVLDRAALGNLLVPSPPGTGHLYDVNLVLRLVKAFLSSSQTGRASAIGLEKVSSLLDSYVAEVAPDPHLKPSKFLALLTALPDSARASYDHIYRAIHMYLEVHTGLLEEEKARMCDAMNYKKLSAEACLSLSRNMKFPPKSAAQALASQQSRLKSLLVSTNGAESSLKSSQDEKRQEVVLYAGELDLRPDNTNLRSHLQGMQWRVMELEKVCQKMQLQMAKIMKSRSTPSQTHTRSLPRLCS